MIVIAACKDDCVTNLSEAGKQWFIDMGSEDIQFLDFRCSFCFIGITGQKEPLEKRSSKNLGDDSEKYLNPVSITQIFHIN